MEVMNVVAVVGAAAWTPQIITWIYRLFTKPVLSVYVHKEPEVGYTTYGPIFNIRCALLSKHKDAVLNKITVTLKHESGACYIFNWAGLSEDVSEIQSPLGPSMSIKKASLPLVVKVIHTGVAQVFVRFLRDEFNTNIRTVLDPAIERFRFLKESGKLCEEKNIDEMIAGKEFNDAKNVFESEFIWATGKYTVTFEFKSPNNFKYKKEGYAFELTHEDIEELKKNLDNVKLDLIQRAKLDAISGFEAKTINWIWRSPELLKKEEVSLLQG